MGKGDPQGGRPPFELSDEDFAKLVGMIRIQCTQDEICGIYGVTDKTLNEALKRRGEPGFSDLLKKHQDEGKASLRRAQWKAAVEKHNPTMLVWMGKQMLGQTDKVVNEHTGKDGGDIKVAAQLDYTQLSTTALKELEGVLSKDDPSHND